MVKAAGPVLAAGDYVSVEAFPEQCLCNMPADDQQAIRRMAGRPLLLERIEKRQGELRFTTDDGVVHWVWLELELMQQADAEAGEAAPFEG